MRELAPNLWVWDRRFRVAGLEVGTRMTAIRLAELVRFIEIRPMTRAVRALRATLRGEEL